jgi:hypothetical protein
VVVALVSLSAGQGHSRVLLIVEQHWRKEMLKLSLEDRIKVVLALHPDLRGEALKEHLRMLDQAIEIANGEEFEQAFQRAQEERLRRHATQEQL